MIQIRQKKEALHNSIRKEFLEKRFRQMRIKLFQNEEGYYEKSQKLNSSKIRQLYQRSMEKNGLLTEIRNNSFLNSLKTCVQNACWQNDWIDKKFLLLLITNILKDQLNPYQIQEVVKMSFKVIESLQISYLHLNDVKQLKYFQKIVEYFSADLLMYYSSQIFQKYQNLEQEDQITIENCIYPMFQKILFYTIQKDRQLIFQKQFIIDVQICIHHIFCSNQEFYEMSNRQKALRLQLFLKQILTSHYRLIQKNKTFSTKFQAIQVKIYWMYDYLSVYYNTLQNFFKTDQLITIVFEGLIPNKQKQKQTNSSIQKHSYSLLRTLIQHDTFIEQINNFMFSQNSQTNCYNFQMILQSVKFGNQTSYQALQVLEGFIMKFSQDNLYSKLIEKFWKKILKLCVQEIQNNHMSFQHFTGNKNSLLKLLTIIYLMIEIGNKTDSLIVRPNRYFVYFSSLSGLLAIQQINKLFEQMSIKQTPELEQIAQLIDWILASDVEFQI